jgi:hypothetical protein
MSLSGKEIESRAELARELGQVAHERRPDAGSWAIWAYGDAPAAIGGGEPAFLWFASQTELLDYIATYLPFDPPGPYGTPMEPVLATVGGVVQRLKNGELKREPARLELNKALKRFSQIEWWGTRSDLFSEDSKFPRTVRAAFRGEYEETSSADGPITAKEEEDFLDFLETYPYA